MHQVFHKNFIFYEVFTLYSIRTSINLYKHTIGRRGVAIVEKSILIIILAAVCEDSGFFYARKHSRRAVRAGLSLYGYEDALTTAGGGIEQGVHGTKCVGRL